MGLLDKISTWFGAGRVEVTVLVLGLDHSGKSTLLNTLRPAELRATHVTPTVGNVQENFTNHKIPTWFGAGRVEVTVLVLGLDHSGKSALLNTLRPAELRATHVKPTVGNVQENFTSGGVSFTAWDVCGAARYRALWERHYRRAHAVIFVVDSTDHLRLVVAREELELMLAHPDMFGRRLPLLVLANKCDAQLALAPAQIAAALCLERITDRPWHICASSGASGAGLAEGVSWLARQLRQAHTSH